MIGFSPVTPVGTWSRWELLLQPHRRRPLREANSDNQEDGDVMFSCLCSRSLTSIKAECLRRISAIIVMAGKSVVLIQRR